MSLKCSRDYFEKLWSMSIFKDIDDCVRKGRGAVWCPDIEGAKEAIWEAYKYFNQTTSERYMKNRNGLLDRHKVAACYMYACVFVRPLRVKETVPEDDELQLVNEALAVSTACSVIAGFLDNAIAEIERLGLDCDPVKLNTAKSQLNGGIQFDYIVGYGTYLNSMLSCLCYTADEKNYNVLAMSIILFHWEDHLLDDEVQKCIAELIRMLDEEGADRGELLISNETTVNQVRKG